MRPPASLLLAALAALAACVTCGPSDELAVQHHEDRLVGTESRNETVSEVDGDHEPVVRRKRTFGDIVFRGLADVLGYAVARKPTVFPPPLDPVPGIDAPLQAAPASPAPPPPCGAPRAAAPPPCRAQRPKPPPPPPPPPCPKPRAAPKPKPRPPPPPPPPPPRPCATPRVNPTTPSPCAPSPPAPPPKDNIETVSSNFQLNFNWNRATAAPQADPDPQQEEDDQPVPLLIQPQAARLPPAEPRQSRVYVDAFVVNDGVAERVDTVDAKTLPAHDDYLAYDEEPPSEDYYEDVQESRDRGAAVQRAGVALDRFWENNKRQKATPTDHYKNVHFGERDLARTSHQSLQRTRGPNRIPLPLPVGGDDERETVTSTEDPRRPLRPRVLPPTEHHPGQIDTVTVRVPPIYKEKRPDRLNRGPDRDEPREGEDSPEEGDVTGEDSWLTPLTEPPRRKRRRKKTRTARSADHYTAGDYDYYGNKIPASEEEQYYLGLTIPPPTVDEDVARHEALIATEPTESERIREGSDRRDEDEQSDESADRADSGERGDSSERAGEQERAHSAERTDRLSPRARVHETGYRNQYLRATDVRTEDSRPTPPRAAP